MYAEARKLPPVLVPLLVAVAILGYLAGIRRETTTSPATLGAHAHVASSTNLLLEYPAGWQPAASAPAIPGLSITRPVVLAPSGRAAEAGLVSGTLPAAGEPGLLPATFLDRLSRLPSTQVVDLIDGQAYRHAGLTLPGYGRRLELYLMPNTGAGPTVLACYATPALASYMDQCQEIVARITLVGQPASNLNPDPTYAQQLSALISSLDRARVKLRRQMATGASAATVGSAASSLAQRFTSADSSLVGLQPPFVAALAQAALSGSILRVRDAYVGLGQAATAGSLSAYQAASERVRATEAQMDRALQSFALLGYSRSS